MAGPKEKWVLITGASSGIGRAFAEVFAARGYSLLLSARDENRLLSAAGDIGHRYGAEVVCLPCDLSAPGGGATLYRMVKERGHTPSVLVNNAGVGVCGEFLDYDSARDDEMIGLNIGAVTALTKLFGREMATAGGGRILNVASLGAYQPGPYIAVYYATKAYVLSFTAAVRRELAPRGVFVCALCPGPVATDFARRAGRAAMRGAMSAERVARCGYRGLLKNRGVILPGAGNKLGAAAAKVMPTPLGAALVGALQRRLWESRREKDE